MVLGKSSAHCGSGPCETLANPCMDAKMTRPEYVGTISTQLARSPGCLNTGALPNGLKLRFVRTLNGF